MKLYNTVFIFFLLQYILTSEKIYSQADISMATHSYNRANYNPATIARTDYIYLFSNVRSQWLDIDGAPTVINMQASKYFHSIRSAFGFSMICDKIGITQLLNPMLSYAFRISNNRDRSLSFGLSAGVFARSINGSLYNPDIIGDPFLNRNLENSIIPDVNAGAEFESTYFIFGISSTHLLSIGKMENQFSNSNHRYAYAIYKNTDNQMFNYNIGLQAVNRSNLTVMEITGGIRLKHPTGLSWGSRELFDVGLTYRTSQQLTFLFGINLSSDLRIGYAYDLSLIPGYYQNGSNEIMLEYRIPSKDSNTCDKCKKQDDWYH